MGMIVILSITIIGTVLGIIIAQDLTIYTPKICNFLVRKAVQNLQEELRERYFEEWHSHLAETSGILLKLSEAFGFLVTAKLEKTRMKAHFLKRLLSVAFWFYKDEIRLRSLMALKITRMRLKIKAHHFVPGISEYLKLLSEISKNNNEFFTTRRVIQFEMFDLLKDILVW